MNSDPHTKTKTKPAFCESWLRPILIFSVPLLFVRSTLSYQAWWTTHALTMLGLTYALFIVMVLIFHCLILQLEETRKWRSFRLLSCYALPNAALMLVMAGTANYLNGGPVVDSPIFALFLVMLVASFLGYSRWDSKNVQRFQRRHSHARTNPYSLDDESEETYVPDESLGTGAKWLIAIPLICLFLYLVVLPFPALIADHWLWLPLTIAMLLALPILLFSVPEFFFDKSGVLRMDLLLMFFLLYQLFWVMALVSVEKIEHIEVKYVGDLRWVFVKSVPVFLVYYASAAVSAYRQRSQPVELA